MRLNGEKMEVYEPNYLGSILYKCGRVEGETRNRELWSVVERGVKGITLRWFGHMKGITK